MKKSKAKEPQPPFDWRAWAISEYIYLLREDDTFAYWRGSDKKRKELDKEYAKKANALDDRDLAYQLLSLKGEVSYRSGEAAEAESQAFQDSCS